MQAQLLLYTLIAFGSSSSVPETIRYYRCTSEKATLEVSLEQEQEHDCEKILTVGTTTIAVHSNNVSRCIQPCVNISSLRIHVSRCAHFSLSVVCMVKGAVKESITHYIGALPISCTLSGQWMLYLILAAITVVTLTVVAWIQCRKRRDRHAGIASQSAEEMNLYHMPNHTNTGDANSLPC